MQLRNRIFSAMMALLLFSGVCIAQETEPAAPTTAAPAVDFAHTDLVDKAMASVVGITAVSPVSDDWPQGASFYGTGTMISADGYCLTSITVVPKECEEIWIILKGGRRVAAKMVGTVDEKEISVIKIEGDGYAYMPLGDSNALRLGDTVYTFGNCFHSIELDDQVSVAAGVVSGFYKLTEARDQSKYIGECIESTAALNPGVDGGPLVNARGELVGLLCLNYNRSRWMGTSIPMALLEKDLLELMGKEDAEASTSAMPRSVPRDANLAAVEKYTIALKVDRAKPHNLPLPPQQPGMRAPQPGSEEAQFVERPDAPVTGVVLSEDGYALTSWFNIAGELNGIEARLPNGEWVKAEVVGWDQVKDIALLKLEAEGLTAPTWVDDHAYGTGDMVFCFGRSPDPSRLTMTEGVISATGRSWGTAIQFEADVNYGNAGGPVVNRHGKLIGIATHANNAAMWGQSSGIGFATVKGKINEVMDDLKAGKQLKDPPRPFLGIEFDTEAIDVVGARIKRVIEDTAAEEAGLKAGDVVTAANGVEIQNPTDLGRQIRKLGVGDLLVMRVTRDGEEQEMKATLGEYKDPR